MIHDVLHSNANGCEGVIPRASAGGGGYDPAAPLGIYTNKTSTDVSDSKNSRFARARRFALKAVVNDILPESRTSKCHRIRAPQQQVQVWRGMSAGVAGKAFYKGLYTCGRLWTCPVCAAKISERRRIELAAAIANAKAQGLSVYLLTQTIRHGLGDGLKNSFAGIARAEKYLWDGGNGQRLRESLGIVGTIKTTEVTWGETNGWHPHKHTLIFLKTPISACELQTVLTPLWIAACVKSGLPAPSIERGLTVQDGSYANAYVSKWGLESEMTKGHSKIAKRGGMTPFALLQNVLDTGDSRSWELFKEYSVATHRKQQLRWSHGLRVLLLPEVAELSDEALVSSEDLEVDAVVWATLSVQEWRAIRFFKYESKLLDMSEDSQSPEVLQFWLDSVSGDYCVEKQGYSISSLNSE